jgi:5-oxoprolinase (ATP-hydrolysing)
MASKFNFSIDRGGTFTDVYCQLPNGHVEVMKLLSVDPAYVDAPREGIRRLLAKVWALKH